jgi:hypothetical protein
MAQKSGGNNGTPWPVWAAVTIIVALIGAYATMNAGKATQERSSSEDVRSFSNPPIIDNRPTVVPAIVDNSVPVAPITKENLDLSGTWSGLLFQQQLDGTFAQYSYMLTISQLGNSVDGTAQLDVPIVGYSVRMRIRGTLAGQTLSYDDGQILATTAPLGWSWCQKTVSLLYHPESDALEGTWTQYGCGSGSISLRR